MTLKRDISTNNICYVDVCNTLFNSNTTFDYIEYYLMHERKWFKRLLFFLITSKFSFFFWIFIVFNKILKKDFHRVCVLLLLQGEKKERLYSTSRLFYEEVLKKVKVRKVHTMLDRFKNELGAKVVLVSASIDPVISIIAESLDVGFISSKLLYVDDITKGKLLEDLHGKKQIKIRGFTSENDQSITVITDNFSDKSFLEKADERIVILNKRSHINNWGDFKANYIKLWED